MKDNVRNLYSAHACVIMCNDILLQQRKIQKMSPLNNLYLLLITSVMHDVLDFALLFRLIFNLFYCLFLPIQKINDFESLN